MVCGVIAEIHRNDKKRATPFTEKDFLPVDPDAKPGVNIDREQTPEEMLHVFEVWLGNGKPVKRLPPSE